MRPDRPRWTTARNGTGTRVGTAWRVGADPASVGIAGQSVNQLPMRLGVVNGRPTTMGLAMFALVVRRAFHIGQAAAWAFDRLSCRRFAVSRRVDGKRQCHACVVCPICYPVAVIGLELESHHSAPGAMRRAQSDRRHTTTIGIVKEHGNFFVSEMRPVLQMISEARA